MRRSGIGDSPSCNRISSGNGRRNYGCSGSERVVQSAEPPNKRRFTDSCATQDHQLDGHDRRSICIRRNTGDELDQNHGFASDVVGVVDDVSGTAVQTKLGVVEADGLNGTVEKRTQAQGKQGEIGVREVDLLASRGEFGPWP